MHAEKLGITLQRFRKYSSSFCHQTAGFGAEKRRRFFVFSAVSDDAIREAVFLRRIWVDLSAGSVDFAFSGFLTLS
jgi:hypothetical protein